MDSTSSPPRPTTSAFATQVTPRRPGPYNPRTPALTAEQARLMVQEEFGGDSHQPPPMAARSGSFPQTHLPGQGSTRTSPTFHTAPEDIDSTTSAETPSKRRRLDSKGKARQFPLEFDRDTHFFTSSTRTSNLPLLNKMATEPQLGYGASAHQKNNTLLTENEILRQLLGEKEKENASLRRQMKLMEKLIKKSSKVRTSDAHMVSFASTCSDMPSFHTRVTLTVVVHPTQLPQRSNSTSNKTQ